MLKGLLRDTSYYLRVAGELIFPRRCAVCGNTINLGYVCEDCRRGYLLRRLVTYTPREEFAAGKAEPQPEDVLADVMLLYKYDGVLKDALHAVKFSGEASLLPLLREEAEAALPDAKLRWLSGFDIITCVPTSPERRAKRGFDVPQELFAPLLEQRSCEFNAQVLQRVRHTAPLFELKPQERRVELAGCFALNPRLDVRGKHILLCDDIYTTGTTMQEAAGVLLAHGAASVHGLALAAAMAHWER